MLRWTEPYIGDSIVNVVLSVNEQIKTKQKMEVDVTSYSHIRPSLQSPDEILKRIEEIEKAIVDLEGHPGEYLRQTVLALKYYARFLNGDSIPYAEMLKYIQQLPCGLISQKKAEGLMETLDKELADFGYKGTLKEKADAWLSESRVAAGDVPGAAVEMIAKAKRGTRQRIIWLPPEDGIDWVKPINGVFWSGMSVYTGAGRGNITFNIDRPWSWPTFASVLTHEAYPGHQTFYSRWDCLYKRQRLPLEASYYLINSPTNALFEGAPETGLHFLGWDDENADTPEMPAENKRSYKAGRCFLDIQRIAQTNACYMVNVHGAEKGDAVGYMMKEGLFNELEAVNSYRYFTHEVQRYYYPSYYHGRWIVGQAYDLTPPENRREFINILYDTPQTTNTFIGAIQDLNGVAFDPLA